jgi:hypothetical protein
MLDEKQVVRRIEARLGRDWPQWVVDENSADGAWENAAALWDLNWMVSDRLHGFHPRDTDTEIAGFINKLRELGSVLGSFDERLGGQLGRVLSGEEASTETARAVLTDVLAIAKGTTDDTAWFEAGRLVKQAPESAGG